LSGGVIIWRFWAHGPTAEPQHVANAEKSAPVKRLNYVIGLVFS
jgi:hypothetical protein